MSELISALELLVATILGFLLYRSAFYGISSPHFIVLLHLYLGCVVRYLYLTWFDINDRLIYIIPIDSITFWELSFFIAIYYTSYSLFFIQTSTKKQTSKFFAMPYFGNKSFVKASFISILCITAYLLLMINNFGGLLEFIYAKLNRVSEKVQGLAYFGLFADIAIAASLASFYYMKRFRNNKYIGFTIVSFSILMLLIQGGRGNFIQYIISLMIITDCLKGKSRIVSKNVILIAIAFILMASAGLAIRKSNQLNIPIQESLTEVSGNLLPTLLSPFSLFDHYELGKIYAERTGHDLGVFYLEQITRPVPRSLWPEKPQVLGKKIRSSFWGDEAGGVPAGFIGEAFISFNIFGIIISAGFLGLLLAKLQKFYLLAMRQREYIFIVAIIVPYVGFNLLRTGVDTAFTRIVIYIISFLLIKYLVKYRINFKAAL